MAFSELDVLEANNAFYDAFARRDRDAMGRVWSEVAPLVCVHPGWRPVFGRRAVLDSWKRIFAASDKPVDVRTTHASVHKVAGAALVVCFELIGEREDVLEERALLAGLWHEACRSSAKSLR